jgi:C4-dicarboxylate-specific signal transduction histidine kinase
MSIRNGDSHAKHPHARYHDGVALREELAPDLAPVLGDRVQLQQVMLNLMMNAIEAMSTAPGNGRQLAIRTRNQKLDVCVAVEDSGPGFDSQSTDRVFETFYTTKPYGMRLGLSISRTNIDAHKGRRWAARNEHRARDTKFTLLVYNESRA